MMNERGGRLVLGLSIAGSFLVVLLCRTYLPVPDIIFATSVTALCFYSACWFAEASKRELLYRIGDVASEVAWMGAMYWIFRQEIDTVFLAVTGAFFVMLLTMKGHHVVREIKKLRGVKIEA